MGDSTRFAIAIAILIGAMIFFFFAFHPGGVEGVNNPVEMIKWLMDEFNNTASKTNDNAPAEIPGTGSAGL